MASYFQTTPQGVRQRGKTRRARAQARVAIAEATGKTGLGRILGYGGFKRKQPGKARIGSSLDEPGFSPMPPMGAETLIAAAAGLAVGYAVGKK